MHLRLGTGKFLAAPVANNQDHSAARGGFVLFLSDRGDLAEAADADVAGVFDLPFQGRKLTGLNLIRLELEFNDFDLGLWWWFGSRFNDRLDDGRHNHNRWWFGRFDHINVRGRKHRLFRTRIAHHQLKIGRNGWCRNGSCAAWRHLSDSTQADAGRTAGLPTDLQNLDLPSGVTRGLHTEIQNLRSIYLCFFDRDLQVTVDDAFAVDGGQSVGFTLFGLLAELASGIDRAAAVDIVDFDLLGVEDIPVDRDRLTGGDDLLVGVKGDNR